MLIFSWVVYKQKIIPKETIVLGLRHQDSGLEQRFTALGFQGSCCLERSDQVKAEKAR